MDHAYLFPFNLTIDRAHARRAKRVTLETDYDELIQASHAEHLRCCYLACLQRVKPVRRDADDDSDLRCFAHVEAASVSVPCPYRDPHDSGETPEQRVRRREHNQRKVIENDLRVALESRFEARRIDAVVQASEYSAPEPCITVTGFGAPFEIRGLAPGCEPLWQARFDGAKDGRPVLFFVLEAEAPRLRQPFIDDHLLQRKPAIVIRPGKREWDEHDWVAASTLRRMPAPAHLLRDVDLVSVDYRRLFGLDRAAETLFIPAPYREALERLAAGIEGGPAPPAIAMMRSLAELLLVDGSGLRPALFGHEERLAPDADALLTDRDSLRFWIGDSVLGPIVARSVASALADARRTAAASRDALARKEAERVALAGHADTAERNRRAAEAKVEELGDKLRVSRDEVARSEAALVKGKSERAALQSKIDRLTDELTKANNDLKKERDARTEQSAHWLVRVDEYLHGR